MYLQLCFRLINNYRRPYQLLYEPISNRTFSYLDTVLEGQIRNKCTRYRYTHKRELTKYALIVLSLLNAIYGKCDCLFGYVRIQTINIAIVGAPVHDRRL